MKTIITAMPCWLVSLAGSVSAVVKGNRVSSPPQHTTEVRTIVTITKEEIKMESDNGILKALSLSLMAVLLITVTGCQDKLTAPVPYSLGKASAAAVADAYVDDDAVGANDGTSWETAYGDLNDALANATDVNGDGAISIWIAEGTYVPSEVYSPGGVEGGAYGEEARSGSGIPLAQYEADRDAGFLNTFYLADGVRLYGGFRGLSGGGGANARNTSTFRTTLSGDNVWHVTSAGNDTPTLGGGAVLMDGLTIENGDAVDALFDGVPGFVWTHREGGGLYAHNTDVSLNDLVVRRNEGRVGGGIILRTRTSFTTSFVATHSTFHDNHAGDEDGAGCCGGAIALFESTDGVGTRNSVGLIENSTFTENTAGGGGGGAVAAFTGLVTVRNSHFEDNSVRHAGGALQARSGDTNFVIEDNAFTRNFAGDRAGAVDMLGEMELRRNTFKDNRAEATSTSTVNGGGAVAAIGSKVGDSPVDIIEDNYFEGNSSGSMGGALLIISLNTQAENPDGPPSAVVNGNKFHDNRAAEFGGAIAVFGMEASTDDNLYTRNSAQVAGGALAFLNLAPIVETFFSVLFGGPLYPVVATVSTSHFADNWVEGVEDQPKLAAFLIPLAEPNVAPGGGAISVDFGADITVVNSSFEGNNARMGDGGAIKNGGSFGIDDPFGIIGGPNNVGSTDLITIGNSTFANNEAIVGNGGALSSGGVGDPAFDDATTLSIGDSFLDNGSAGGDGGAISAVSATLNLSKNHLSDNSAVANGGAVSAFAGTITASKDHYNFNTAGENGGALYLRGVTGDLAQQHFNHNDADGLGDSMYLEGSTLDLSKIQIADEDGDDVVSVPGISPMVARVSAPGAGVRASESTQATWVSLDELGIRWKFLLCDDELRQSSREAGALECSTGGSGQ